MKNTKTDFIEKDALPNLCSQCQTDKPFLKVLRIQFGADCKVCLRPYTVFRWQNGPSYSTTKICKVCSKMKHLCQSCLLDIDLHISAKERDKTIGVSSDVPKQKANRDYFIENTARNMKNSTLLEQNIKLAYSELKNLQKDNEESPIVQKQVCSFFAKGECKRGIYCPFLHELSSKKPTSLKKFQDFYFGDDLL